jgi:hypothetical protein
VSRGYQQRDARFIDYELYELPGVNGVFRGPPVRSDSYIACLGAAQTFGRFVPLPFPRLIAGDLAIETLNLGRGGVGPAFPLSSPELMNYANRARAVIVQVFSGRSQSSSRFRLSGFGVTGVNLITGMESSVDEFFTWALENDSQLAREIVIETREAYLRNMERLLDLIRPPKILLWFSVREPDYQESYEMPLPRLFGDFPHLVNRPMVDRLRTRCDIYVECVSRRGLPQLIFDRDTVGDSTANGSHAPENIIARNQYYPSPEMHEDAATLLAPACRELLKVR